MAEAKYGGKYNSKSDVFSFGMVVYEVAMSDVPFGRRLTRDAIRRRIERGELPMFTPSPSFVPSPVRELGLKCLSFNPADRPSASMIVQCLDKMIELKVDENYDLQPAAVPSGPSGPSAPPPSNLDEIMGDLSLALGGPSGPSGPVAPPPSNLDEILGGLSLAPGGPSAPAPNSVSVTSVHSAPDLSDLDPGVAAVIQGARLSAAHMAKVRPWLDKMGVCEVDDLGHLDEADWLELPSAIRNRLRPQASLNSLHTKK